MIHKFHAFKDNIFDRKEESPIKESVSESKPVKKVKKIKKKKTQDPQINEGQTVNGVNFLRNSASTRPSTPVISRREEPIEEKHIPTPPSEEDPKGPPVVNEGFLSRDFVESWLGTRLNSNRQEPPKQETPRQEPKKEPHVEKKEPIKEAKTPPQEPRKKPKPPREERIIEEQEDFQFEEPVREEPEFTNFNHQEEPQFQKDPMAYKLFRDKAETFECRVHVEGSTLANTKVRLLIESNEWNLYFNGRMTSDGRCVIPLKKMRILSEGLKGKIMLEITVEDTVFYPWQETFQVQTSKKVRVEILSGQPQKQNGPKVTVSGI
jgi:hypothetical protein